MASRRELASCLRERRGEIEEALLTRTYAIADTSDVDPLYRESLRKAVGVALDYSLETIERGEDRAPPPPPALLAQARMAARSGIGLDLVLRRYQAGYGLLADSLIEEAGSKESLGVGALRELLRGQAAVLDRLLCAVSDEYTREAQLKLDSNERRRTQRIERLLAGEPIDTSEFFYAFDVDHIGIVATGANLPHALRDLASKLDCRLLLARRGEGSVWAWLGGRRPPDPAEVQRDLRTAFGGEFAIAIGEPAAGVAGWRLTHKQAFAALPLAARSSQSIVRYADVPLLASVIQDELLAGTLRRLFLDPLKVERDGGEALFETLEAYLASGRNVSSTAAAVGISRNTVAARLATAERKIGRPLASCAAELEVALQLRQLDPLTSPLAGQFPQGIPSY